MNEFQVLLDAPGTPVRRVTIARTGPISDPRYGDFEIDARQVRDWNKNLSALPGGKALVDFEHRSERKPRDSQAAGWISAVHLESDGRVTADVSWTKQGAKAIRQQRYLFLSPAFGEFTNEKGETFQDVLHSVALTNKPQISDQVPLALAAPERLEEAHGALKLFDISEADRKAAAAKGWALSDGSYPIRDVHELRSAAILAASGHGDVKSARKLIRKRAADLGVSLSHLPGFGSDGKGKAGPKKKMSAAGKGDRKILEQAAAASGLVMMSKKKLRKLEAAAADRQVAQRQLEHQGFEHAFAQAVKARRATPGQEADYRRVYQLDRATALRMLETAPPVLLDKPLGAPTIDFSNAPPDVDLEAASHAGFNPNSVVLDARVQRRLRELQLPQREYPRILDQVIAEEMQ